MYFMRHGSRSHWAGVIWRQVLHVLSVNAVAAVPLLLLNFVREGLLGAEREEYQHGRLVLCNLELRAWLLGLEPLPFPAFRVGSWCFTQCTGWW